MVLIEQEELRELPTGWLVPSVIAAGSVYDANMPARPKPNQHQIIKLLDVHLALKIESYMPLGK